MRLYDNCMKIHTYRQFKYFLTSKTVFTVKDYISLHYVQSDNSQVAKYFIRTLKAFQVYDVKKVSFWTRLIDSSILGITDNLILTFI